MTIWAPVMFRNELDMLRLRLEEMQDYDVRHVIVESPVTHRGVPKPLHLQEIWQRFMRDRITHIVADLPDAAPWVREHAQRNAAWPTIDSQAADDDTVLICDLDEIPSPSLMKWDGPGPVGSARMRTTLFAVDWEVPGEFLPPTCVVAKAGWLRERAAHGHGLAEVRDSRDMWPVIHDGGWHFSWTGGAAAQREKLETATCHEELLTSPEGTLIADGTRYRTAENGGGLPVVPVDVDETWPAMIREKRCPPEWFRPRGD